MARRFQLAIIVVAHPTRESGKNATVKDASLYDISGGAAWNNKADIGIVVLPDDTNVTVRHIKIENPRTSW
jgi:twinkle protein